MNVVTMSKGNVRRISIIHEYKIRARQRMITKKNYRRICIDERTIGESVVYDIKTKQNKRMNPKHTYDI